MMRHFSSHITRLHRFAGDLWGGTAAMLVALPAALAFGVTVYGSISGTYAAYGAMAGIIGVAVLGLLAAPLGGTNRLISAPSAPAAAVLSAFAIEHASRGVSPEILIILVTLVALIAGIFQILFGVVRLGQMIKYMPYPVVSGYLGGVGIYIIASQLPKVLGSPERARFWESVLEPSLWQWQSLSVGGATIVAMFIAQKLFRTIPAVIVALGSGIGVYLLLGLVDGSLLIENNPFIIGELHQGGNIDYLAMLSERFEALVRFDSEQIAMLILPAMTLAALLSIDTLKTCIIVDSMTHSYHNPNRELVAQGIGNVVSALFGGMSGSGTMGATMVNISAGASSRLSGMVEGIAAIIAILVFERYIEWIPVSALAAVLVVIGFRMIDRNVFSLLRSRQTVLDFLIIISVIFVAVTFSLIAAAAIGVAMAVILYIVRQFRMSVVYRHRDGVQTRSRIDRREGEEALLRERGEAFSVYELHGSLFFGTANQLFETLQSDLKTKKYIILDLKRVQTIDLTAAHILLQIKDILHDRNGYLLLSRLPHKLPTGEDMESYFNHVGLIKHLSPMRVFDDLEDALVWVEEKLIASHGIGGTQEVMELEEFDLFRGRNKDTMEELRGLVESRSYQKGDVIYLKGDQNGEVFLIRSGRIKIILPIDSRKRIHLSTLSPNSFFGEFSFFEGAPQYADAIAAAPSELYVISRRAFDHFAEHHHKASFQFMQSLAMELARRLRTARAELARENDV